MTVSKKAATTLSTAFISFAVGMLKTVALCVTASCSETRHYHAPKPVSAELQIFTVDPKTGERKWITHAREVYRYEEEANDQRGPAEED